MERKTKTSKGVRLPSNYMLAVDWADLGEKDFELALQPITTVEELSGVANQRWVLN